MHIKNKPKIWVADKIKSQVADLWPGDIVIAKYDGKKLKFTTSGWEKLSDKNANIYDYNPSSIKIQF